jgi:competence protein ComEA
MAIYMLSAFTLNTKIVGQDGAPGGLTGSSTGGLPTRRRVATCPTVLVTLTLALSTTGALAQLPDGPGKAETERVCSQCHELERSISLHQDRDAWQATMNKMVGLGAKGTEKEFQAVVDYLAKNYPGEAVPKLDVNHAESIDLESGLSLKRSEAAAIIQYRTRNGPFKSVEDLKKVPGIDAAKIEAKKDRLVFQ